MMPQSSLRAVKTDHLPPAQIRIAAIFWIAALLVGLFQYFALWQLNPDGLSPVGKRLPYWDFTNLWGGSKMALEGHVGYLFDVSLYREELQRIFGIALPEHEWSYPPSLLLIGVPLALLPVWLAYIVWSAGTILLWHLAVRPFRLPPVAHLFAVLNPAILSSFFYGQNGALTAALLIGGLLNAPARPVLAGILFGCLAAIKPHLGLVIPFCLIASWNVRAFITSGVTLGALLAATGMLFGFDVWTGFWTHTRPLMTLVMEMPYPQAYHTHTITGFIFSRSLGLDLSPAYLFQAAISVSCIITAVWLWRPANRLDHRSRVAVTGLLAVLALPYGYTHDSAPVFLAIIWFFLVVEKPVLALFGLLWLFPFVFPRIHDLGFSAGFLGPAFLAVFLGYQIASGRVRPVDTQAQSELS